MGSRLLRPSVFLVASGPRVCFCHLLSFDVLAAFGREGHSLTSETFESLASNLFLVFSFPSTTFSQYLIQATFSIFFFFLIFKFQSDIFEAFSPQATNLFSINLRVREPQPHLSFPKKDVNFRFI